MGYDIKRKFCYIQGVENVTRNQLHLDLEVDS